MTRKAVGAWLFILFGQPFMVRADVPLLTLCHDYHCDQPAEVILRDLHWRDIRSLFAEPAPGAKSERQRIAQAVARFERYVGMLNGTAKDLAKNLAGSGMPGQLDCIAESINTTVYLRALEDAGLLRWHTVENRVRRVGWILEIHWTAVIRAHSNQQRFAVDSWHLDNGRAPYIQKLGAWLKREQLPFNPDAPES